jgi:hypothetical protein
MQYSQAVPKLRYSLDELTSADVLTIDSGEAVSMLRLLTPEKRRLEWLCSSLAARAIAGNEHVGSKNAASFIAGITGVSEREANKSLAVQKRVRKLPDVQAAAARGEISGEQANAIAEGADDDADLARELFDGAADKTVEDIQAEARTKTRARACSEQEHNEKIRKKRTVSDWTDADSLYNVLLKLTAERAAAFRAKHRSYEATLVREEGATWGNHRADAFCALIDDLGGLSTTRNRVVVHVDYEAFMRGWVEERETCEIPGLGSVPIAYAQALLDDCILRVVITKKNRIVWFGGEDTGLPERIKEAVIAGARGKCGNCGDADRLQVDHKNPRVKGGSHDLNNLQCLCWQCHRAKTQTRDAPWTADKIYGKDWNKPPAA